jgi:molecular chaperone HtpG
MTKETLGFQAEVKQLLDLMIHSLYSNKEIFLRELVSNASDAADKLRFEALANNALYDGDADLKISVAFDKEKKTLTVSDNGIGMSRDEAVKNLGTIAKSGTREFFQSLTGDQAKDARLIGQFGVGFYSSFIVADRVTVVTRRAGLPANEAVRWECDMSKDAAVYTVEGAEKEGRGTDVILHLRDGEEDFLEKYRLESVLKKYSDHIAIPITMEGEAVNQASALWTRPKSEITDEQYIEFYKHVGHDFEPPLAWTHNRVEGRQEYTQLLYIPARAPFDLWDREHRRGLKLYVRRVFIMDDAAQLLPSYLRFVRGIVDSSDLPLNVSREILQESRDVEAIRSGCTRRVLDLLESLSEKEKDKYAQFWREFGRVMKEGPGEDHVDPRRERGAACLARRLRQPDEGGPGPHLLRHCRKLARGALQPAPRDLPLARRRGAAAARAHRRVAGRQPERVRGQAPRVGGARRSRPVESKVGGEGARARPRGRRLQGPAGEAEGRARREDQGCAHQQPPDAVALVPRVR